jgi:hypothetical protein
VQVIIIIVRSTQQTTAADRSIDGISTVRDFVDLIDSGERTDLLAAAGRDRSIATRQIDRVYSSSSKTDRSRLQQQQQQQIDRIYSSSSSK